ncbi:MAG: hypothetical protein U1E42_04620 [Rhodospirillales bacterium]
MEAHKPNRGGATRATISALVTLAFVFRLMLAAMPMPSSSTTAANFSLIPICTVEGVKWRAVRSETPASPAKAPTDRPLCALCAAALGLTALLPVAGLVIPAEMTGAATVFPRSAPVLPIATRPPPSRGPPLPVGL